MGGTEWEDWERKLALDTSLSAEEAAGAIEAAGGQRTEAAIYNLRSRGRCEWTEYVRIDECAEPGCGMPEEFHKHPSLAAHKFKANDAEVRCRNAAEVRVVTNDSFSPDESAIVMEMCREHGQAEYDAASGKSMMTASIEVL